MAPWRSSNPGGAGSDATSSARKPPDWRAKFQRTSWEERRRRTALRAGKQRRWNSAVNIKLGESGRVQSAGWIIDGAWSNFGGVIHVESVWSAVFVVSGSELWLSLCPYKELTLASLILLLAGIRWKALFPVGLIIRTINDVCTIGKCLVWTRLCNANVVFIWQAVHLHRLLCLALCRDPTRRHWVLHASHAWPAVRVRKAKKWCLPFNFSVN